MRLKTNDLYYGAFLLSGGGRLEGFDVEDLGSRRKIFFEFSGDGLEGLSKEYLSGRALANVRELKSALKHLKEIVLNQGVLTLKEKHHS